MAAGFLTAPTAAGHAESETVGRGAVHIVCRDHSAGAFHVLHGDAGVAGNEAAEVPGDQTAGGVDAAARVEADHQRDALALVEVVRSGGCGQVGGQRSPASEQRSSGAAPGHECLRDPRQSYSLVVPRESEDPVNAEAPIRRSRARILRFAFTGFRLSFPWARARGHSAGMTAQPIFGGAPRFSEKNASVRPQARSAAALL